MKKMGASDRCSYVLNAAFWHGVSKQTDPTDIFLQFPPSSIGTNNKHIYEEKATRLMFPLHDLG